MVQKVTDSEFSQLVSSNKKIVIKYFANWCGACRLFAPKFTKISNKEEYSDIVFVEVNAEENPQARKFGEVKSLPFFATVKDGVILKGDSIAKEEPLELMIKELING